MSVISLIRRVKRVYGLCSSVDDHVKESNLMTESKGVVLNIYKVRIERGPIYTRNRW